jgi:hypothetical protein
MSARCMAAVFDRYPSGGGEFALALALADNAHDDGTHIYPGVPTMAHKSRQTERNVQNHLRAMVASGWLQIVKRSVGRGRNNEYRISPAWLKGEEISPITPPVDNSEKGEKQRTKRVKTAAQKGENGDTPYRTGRTSIEPITPNPLAGGACGFESIAAGYPRRAGIEAARRDWDELAPDATLQAEIARAIQAWIPSAEWQREGGRYIPKFGRFLRDERWLDAPGRAAPSPAPAPASPREPPLTTEQLARNVQHAAQAAALARQAFGRGARP